MARRPGILGLIGGIGSGKSLVAREFAKHGGYLISGDALGHEALRRDDIKRLIVSRWGAAVLNEAGEIQRAKVAAIVFADHKELRALEAMVFPVIGMRIREEIAKAGQAPFVIVDAAVMVEAGWDKNCDHIVFVDAPEDVRLRRMLKDRGWTEAEVRAREKAQLPVEEKRRRADFIVDNSGTMDDVAPQVTRILASLKFT